MHLQFVGCGDAFGSGGRFNTCFHLVGRDINALIDCGATSLVGLNKLAINRNDINTIFITHFHADHIGGLPFFILESNYVLKRQRGAHRRRAAGPEIALRRNHGDSVPRHHVPGMVVSADAAGNGDRPAQRHRQCADNAVSRDARRPGRALPRLSHRSRRQGDRFFRRYRNGRIPSSISGAMPTCSSARPIRAINRSPPTWRSICWSAICRKSGPSA